MKFIKINGYFNAEPNAPAEKVTVDGNDVTLEFDLNAFVFKQFQECERGRLVFLNCYKYRLGPTNDEGWYRGQCRYSKIAPAWGEFYMIQDSDWRESFPDDEIVINAGSASSPDLKHFLFYLRDNTFEAICGNFRCEPPDRMRI